jgi:predicted  nucleic acid-binding Zn-ribbon protein
MTNIVDTIKARIESIESEITALKIEIDNFDPCDHCDESDYVDMIDDVYGEVEICGMSYRASYALEMVDPVAFRVGFSDWASSRDNEDFEEYNDMTERLDELVSELADLEDELEELESEEEHDE